MLIVQKHLGQGLCNRLIMAAYGLYCGRRTCHDVLIPSVPEARNGFASATATGLISYSHTTAPSWIQWSLATPLRVLYWARKLESICKRIPALRACRVKVEANPFFQTGSNELMKQLTCCPFVLLDGWVGSFEMTPEDAALIQSIFRPSTTVLNEVGATVTAARKETDILVGVHIRWGDYKTFKDGIYFHPAEDYALLMRHIAGLFPGKRVSFLIVTNGQPAREAFAGLSVTFGPGSVLGDLYSLAQCDYIVGPPSTYSIWAAFYGEKRLWKFANKHDRPRIEDFTKVASF
jgi:hypothetical protein